MILKTLFLSPRIPLMCALFALAPTLARSQISVSGVSTRSVYTDSVTFTVQTAAGWDYLVLLDQVPVPAGQPVTVNRVDYHELQSYRTNQTTQAVESDFRHFIVRSSERGGSENGIPVFVPRPVIPSAADEFAGATLSLMVPAVFPSGYEIPVVARVVNPENHTLPVNGSLAAPGHPSIPIKRGHGSGFLSADHPPGELEYRPAIQGVTSSKTIAIESSTSWAAVSGVINNPTVWPDNARIHVAGGLTVSAGATLAIGAGAIVRLNGGIDITNNGTVLIQGTTELPVVFMPANPSSPWGGFIMRSGTGSITATGVIFTGSGANPDWFGANGNPGSHRDEQALFFVANDQSVDLTDSAAIRLAGQLGHAVNGGDFRFTRFLNQHCTTGGEYTGADFTVNDSAFIEFPDDSATFVDGDNDGLYLVSGTHAFTNTVIGWTKDDGIDSGGGGAGVFNYQHCWFEANFHEGNSLSGVGKDVRHFDGVFLNNGQGLEAGYDAPTGRVERCLMIGNMVGARFGDNYDWDYNGFLRAYDSILIHNHRDVWGYNWDDWTYRIQNMDIQDNLLSVPNPNHSSNTAWNPGLDASRLAAFRRGIGGKVGVGFALRSRQFNLDNPPASLPVGLSVFSTQIVTVHYEILADSVPLEGGTVEFAPGEVYQDLPLNLPSPGSYELVQVRLSNPVQADITGGSSAILVRGLAALQTLIPTGSVWRYSDTGTDRGTVWRFPGYDDSTWGQGPAELGFGDGDEATVINGGPSNARYPTAYFRRMFAVADPEEFTGLEVRLRHDDGGVVYLNGLEVFRSNMPGGVISYTTLTPASTPSETAFFTAQIPASGLVQGANLIAVEIHQSSSTSSDLSFEMELTGSLVPALNTAPAPDELLLYWTDPGFVLEDAPAVTGPWSVVPGASSPWSVTPDRSQQFFRLRQGL